MRCIWQNYGHIDENGFFVRKCPTPKKAITDKMGKNGRLSVKIQPFRPGFTDKCSKKRLVSVNLHHNVQKFTDKSPENAGLSVKCVLLTDKMGKNGRLSVNLSEILDRLVGQHWHLKKPDKSNRKSTAFVRHFV